MCALISPNRALQGRRTLYDSFIDHWTPLRPGERRAFGFLLQFKTKKYGLPMQKRFCKALHSQSHFEAPTPYWNIPYFNPRHTATVSQVWAEARHLHSTRFWTWSAKVLPLRPWVLIDHQALSMFFIFPKLCLSPELEQLVGQHPARPHEASENS